MNSATGLLLEQRGLLHTENMPLGRLCKMWNPFFYEFRVVPSVNVFRLICGTDTITGFIRGILRGVRYAKSLRVLFLHRRSPSWTTLVLYSRAVFIFNEPTKCKPSPPAARLSTCSFADFLPRNYLTDFLLETFVGFFSQLHYAFCEEFFFES